MKKLITIALVSMMALFSSAAFAQDDACKITIEGNDAMQFNLKEFTIDKAACAEFTIELKHPGSLPKAAMGHNVVVTKTADAAAVVADGITAGLENNYVKPDDARVIAHTNVIGGGESTSITFKTDALEAGGDYEFFCSFPGHYAMMKGKVTVK